jgi:HEAT repeat protein
MVLAVLIVLILGIALLVPSRSPQYQGKTLWEWVQALPNNYVPLLQRGPPNEAQEALRHVGSNAIPYLIRMLRARDSAFVENIKCRLDKYPFINFAYRHAWQDRIDALKAVAVLGPVAQATIPEISNVLTQRLEVNLALRALGAIGPEAVPSLLQALTMTNNNARDTAAFMLTQFREQSAQIVPAFMVYLDDPNPGFRAQVAKDLREFGPAAEPAVPKLLMLAGHDKDPNTRKNAVQTLDAVDREGALRRFLQELESPEAKVRAAAAESLRWLEHAGEPAVPALVRHLRDPDQTVRRSAALALGDIGQQPDLVVPALLESLDGQDFWLRTFSALALGKFGERSKSAVPAIQALLGDQSADGFYAAELRQALRKIDPTATFETAPKNR